MAKYIKAIDIWEYADAVMSGQIKLQPGQWIKLGADNNKLSRFHYAKPGYIRAFHYPRHVSGFMEYVKATKEAEERKNNLTAA